jgi:hypothetical protein
MPAQDRVRGDQPMATQCSRQPPHEGGEHGPVRPVQARSWVGCGAGRQPHDAARGARRPWWRTFGPLIGAVRALAGRSSTATAVTRRDHVRPAIIAGQRPRPNFWHPTGLVGSGQSCWPIARPRRSSSSPQQRQALRSSTSSAALTVAPRRPHDRAHRLAPALVRDADHRCGREGLRVPEVGDSAPVRSRPSREALESDLGDVQGHHHGRYPHGPHVRDPGPAAAQPASALVQPFNANRAQSMSDSIPTRPSTSPRRCAAQQTHTTFARVLKRLSR